MNELELISEELKRPRSRRRKKITRLITPKLISDIESEIIKIEIYLNNFENFSYLPSSFLESPYHPANEFV